MFNYPSRLLRSQHLPQHTHQPLASTLALISLDPEGVETCVQHLWQLGGRGFGFGYGYECALDLFRLFTISTCIVRSVKGGREGGRKVERSCMRTLTVLIGNPSGTRSAIGISNCRHQRRRSRTIHLSLSVWASCVSLHRTVASDRERIAHCRERNQRTFDLKRWAVVGRFHDSAQEDRGIRYVAVGEGRGVLPWGGGLASIDTAMFYPQRRCYCICRRGSDCNGVKQL